MLKNKLKKNVDSTSENAAIASAFTVLIAVIIKSLILAIPLGIAVALAHHHGKKAKSRKK